MTKQNDGAIGEIISKVGAYLNSNYLVRSQKVSVDDSDEKPRVKVSVSVINFLDNPRDLTDMMRGVRKRVPGQWGVKFGVKVTF